MVSVNYIKRLPPPSLSNQILWNVIAFNLIIKYYIILVCISIIIVIP